jgi:DNA-binding NtrC family response regulator
MKKRILVIDDDKSILRVFTRILQRQGYSTETAETGREALERIGSQSYDLALIDVKLPDEDGIDLLGKIKVSKPNMVNIMITGFASMDNAVRALNVGADAYLVKPVNPEELIRIVKDKLNELKDMEGSEGTV